MTGLPSTTSSSPAQSPNASFRASNIETTLTKSPRSIPTGGTNHSNKECTDHMIKVHWDAAQGWSDPIMCPYGPISLMPTASVLQYATECFEGMKVYRGYDGKLRLFRPRLNCRRMQSSVARISLPGFDAEELLKLIVMLVSVDGSRWLPRDRAGSSLYIRPTMLGTDADLGFDVPKEATLYIFIAVGLTVKNTQSFSEQALTLLASGEDAIRAWPGGTGAAKLGANYGPALQLHGQARKNGYDQVLWLLGKEGIITEAGSSNIFVIWVTADGVWELITPPLQDKTILPGVTRQSILDLSRARFGNCYDAQPLRVVERTFTLSELEQASHDGRLRSVFTTGTANFVMPVKAIDRNASRLEIPVGACQHMEMVRKWLADIMYGVEKSDWALEVDESPAHTESEIKV